MYDLKGFRQAFNLTQNQLAELFNCKQSNISGMEKSMRDLEPHQKEALIKKYGEASVNKFVVSSFLRIMQTKRIQMTLINPNIQLIYFPCQQWAAH